MLTSQKEGSKQLPNFAKKSCKNSFRKLQILGKTKYLNQNGVKCGPTFNPSSSNLTQPYVVRLYLIPGLIVYTWCYKGYTGVYRLYSSTLQKSILPQQQQLWPGRLTNWTEVDRGSTRLLQRKVQIIQELEIFLSNHPFKTFWKLFL